MSPQEIIQAVNNAETKEEAVQLLADFAERERAAFKKRLRKAHMTFSGIGSLLLTGTLALVATGASYLLGAEVPETYAQGFAFVGVLVSGYFTWRQSQGMKKRLAAYDKIIAPTLEQAKRLAESKKRAPKEA